MNSATIQPQTTRAKLSIAAFLWVFSLGLTACDEQKLRVTQQEQIRETVRVGLISSLTGRHAAYGISMMQGVQLALTEFHRGKPDTVIQLVPLDDQSTARGATSSVQRIAKKERVQILIAGLTSETAVAVAPFAQRAQIPMITPSATRADLTSFGDSVFQTCFRNETQAKVLGALAVSELKKTRLAVLKDLQSEYSIGLAKTFRSVVEQKGGKIVAEEVYTPSDTDFTEQLDSIAASGAEALFIPGYHEDLSKILATAAQLNLDMTYLGADGWDASGLWAQGLGLKQETYFTSHFHSQEPQESVKSFVKAYRKTYNETPDAFSALGYDTGHLIGRVVKQVSRRQPEDLKTALTTALKAMSEHQGVTGTINFANRETHRKSTAVIRLSEGKSYFHSRSVGHQSK